MAGADTAARRQKTRQLSSSGAVPTAPLVPPVGEQDEGRNQATNPVRGSSRLLGNTIAYPEQLPSVPFASYFKITRYEYNAGLAAARNEHGQQDALGAMGQSGMVRGMREGVSDMTQRLYGYTNQESRNRDIDARIKGAAEAQTGEGMFDWMNPASYGENGRWAQKESIIENQNYEGFFTDGQTMTLQDGTVITNAEQLRDIKDASQRHIAAKKSVFFLPMPNEYSYSYNSDWSNEFKLGTMARVMDDGLAAAGQMLVTGTAGAVGGLVNAAGVPAAINDAADFDVSGIIGDTLSGATDSLGNNSTLTKTNVLGLAGLAPNDNAVMMFSKMQMRSFDVTFELFARNPTESHWVNELINNFKTGMHPTASAKGTGGLLGFPDLWILEPWFNACDAEGNVQAGGVRHPQMPKSKMCALTSMQVNATPANQFVTTYSGKLPLQTITLSFKETTALTQSDLKVGHF